MQSRQEIQKLMLNLMRIVTKLGFGVIFLTLISFCVPQKNTSSELVASESETCDVVIVGGSTAALAAALSSADSNVKTCLLEPTNWPAGQMTASGVSAIDFAHHRPNDMKLPEASLDNRNWNKDFAEALNPFRSNPGKCWVSNICYEPKLALQKTILPMIQKRSPTLKVFYETTVTSVVKKNEAIVSLVGVKRTAKKGGGYKNPLSQDLADWYSSKDSQFFSKKVITFSGSKGTIPVIIDASEFGDILVLADAPYLQGTEVSEDSLTADEQCGQAIVYPFVLEAVAKKNNQTPNKPLESPKTPDMTNPIDTQVLPDNGRDMPGLVGTADSLKEPIVIPLTALGNEKFESGIPKVQTDIPGFFSMGKFNWFQIWSYRRIRSLGSPAGDMSLQNWFPGNDYPGGYFLKSKAAAKAETSRWSGGIDLDVLRRAENHAFAWATFYADKTPANPSVNIKLDKTLLGTEHGLAKMPYVRDTRRSLGLDNFLLKFKDLDGSATGSSPIGTPFDDRVAIGAYVADFHNIQRCPRREYLNSHETLPFFIPFRALTNQKIPNLLVAGKTMAQTFHANAATRLQPIEWNSGSAAGTAAAMMIKRNYASTSNVLQNISDLQNEVIKKQPINWTIEGKVYPNL
ncbi:MAG: FAD-dependent oxidoreductase [Pseudomonadota bacterium]